MPVVSWATGPFEVSVASSGLKRMLGDYSSVCWAIMVALSGLVGVIGDIHAEDAVLERVLDYFEANRVGSLICVGDVVDGSGCVNRCCRLLRASGTLTVRGNHDRWLFSGTLRDLPDATPLESISEAARELLKALPPTMSFESPVGSILLGHGIGEHDMALLLPFDPACMESSREAMSELRAGPHSVYIGGHTHLPSLLRFPELTVINAGTLRSEQHPVCSILDLDQGTWRLLSVGRRFEQRCVEDLVGPTTDSVRRYLTVSSSDAARGAWHRAAEGEDGAVGESKDPYLRARH